MFTVSSFGRERRWRHIRCMRLIVFIAVFVLSSASAAAQSKAKAPILDAVLYQHLVSIERLTPIELPDLSDRVVVISFFASWCPPCRPEFETLKRLDETFDGSGLSIIAINIFEDFFAKDASVRLGRFLERMQPPFAVVRADQETPRIFGGIDRIPTVFVYDRGSRPAFTFIHQPGAEKMHVGFDELKAVVSRLLHPAE